MRRSTQGARVSGDRSLLNLRGPRKIEDFVGNASAPRRECGVRRREPECRATGVYQIERGPAKSAILWGTPVRHGGPPPGRLRAGEMKMIKNPPRQGRFFARQAEPRNPIPQSASPPAPFTQGSLTGALSPSPVGGPGGTFLLPVEH